MSDQTPASSDPTNEVTTAMSAEGEAASAQHEVSASPGEMIGEFKLIKQLGSGGMAVVWLAEQTSLHRKVALKLLRPDLMADATYVKRFQTEAKAAAGLSHPNIVQVYVIGEEEGLHFIAQEYVQGSTLKNVIEKKGPLELNLALHIMRQVAGALQAAGQRGIIHRDIKPENIMLTKKGEAKVADFGLAQLTLSDEKLNLTQEGITLGTPLYMSPEQVKGKKLDVRSDIYSFGVTCYHMLSGRPPFQGETAISVAVQHLQNDPSPLKDLRPDMPLPVCQLIERMMAKEPDERYPDAGRVLEDIRKLIRALKESGRVDQVKLSAMDSLQGTPSFASRRPILTLTMLSLLAAAASAGVGYGLRPKDPRLKHAQKDFGVQKAATAEAQYRKAMFNRGNENQWLAVIHYWDSSAGSEWAARAREQLVLMYLRDQSRWEDAEKQIRKLASYGGEFQAKARAARAVLNAYRGKHSAARQILESSRQLLVKYDLWPGAENSTNRNALWKKIIADAQHLATNPNGTPPGHAPNNSPPSPPPRR